jgi:5'-3' exonuclease
MSSPVLLVDAMNLLARQHYALPLLRDETGRYTGAIYGILNTVQRLRTKYTDTIVFLWDGDPTHARVPSWRQKLLPSYKGGRLPSEGYAAMMSQRAPSHEFLQLLGYASYGVDGLEADDLIGLLTAQHGAAREVIILSRDKDYFQLITPNVSVLRPVAEAGGYKLITVQNFPKLYGGELSPKQYLNFLALAGDSTDNIKALKGIGPKTAMTMILAGVDPSRETFAQLPKAAKMQYQHLIPHWKDFHLAYQLIALPSDPYDPRIEAFAVDLANFPVERKPSQSIYQFVRKCGSYSLASMIAKRKEFYAPIDVTRPSAFHRHHQSPRRPLLGVPS